MAVWAIDSSTTYGLLRTSIPPTWTLTPKNGPTLGMASTLMLHHQRLKVPFEQDSSCGDKQLRCGSVDTITCYIWVNLMTCQ
mmetsp:Transcript_20219/g.30312  ORF Transcript_20219/g.30312 Transcript_20219/m.30312 type:complete len:82 (+) Transcript_20219:458-703(+)